METNTFGGSVITLGEFDLAKKTVEINRRACELAHEAIAEFAHDGRKRFVVGAIGPGTKLPSLGHIGYDELEASFIPQAEGLLLGHADVILIETSQDPLQVKAAINPSETLFMAKGREAGAHTKNGFEMLESPRLLIWSCLVLLPPTNW